MFMTRMRKEGTYPDVCALLQPKFYGTKGCMPPKKVVSRTKKRKIHFNRWGSRKRTLFIGTEISSLVLYSPCRVPTIIYRHTYLSLLFLFTLFTFFLPFTAKFLCTILFIFPSGLLAFGEYNTITIPTPNHTSYLNNVVESSSLTSSPGRPLLWMPQKSSQSGSYVSLHAFFDDDVFVS